MICIIENTSEITTSYMGKKSIFVWKIKTFKLIFVLMLFIKLPRCNGQGKMIEPPMRSSMWRYGFNTPINYQDDFLNCGGHQRYIANNEKCGTCGDPYDGIRHNEAGGQYATGIVSRYFSLSETHIPVTIELTESYGGKFEFRLCPHNNVNVPVSQMCLDRNLLLIKEGVSQGTPYSFEPKTRGTYNLTLRIPDGMFCTQCVLQWKYRAENSSVSTPKVGECIGCNFIEHFQNCADITIGYYPELLPNFAVTRTSDHWTDQIKHLLQPDAYKFNLNGTENIQPFTKITTNMSSILLSTIPPPPLQEIAAKQPPPIPIISTLTQPPYMLIPTIPPPPLLIKSTIPPPPLHIIENIPLPQLPLISTSSEIEKKSEHVIKIPPPPRIHFLEHPLVNDIVSSPSNETSIHHYHTDGKVPHIHLKVQHNVSSAVFVPKVQNDSLIEIGTFSTVAHDLHHNTFTTKKMELNVDKIMADNLHPSQAPTTGIRSSSNMVPVSSSPSKDSTNYPLNASREILNDIETRIAIAELILSDQLSVQDFERNNTAHIANDLRAMKTKIVSLEDQLKKMENKLTIVAKDLTKVKAFKPPAKSSRKEIFRRIGLEFHFPKETTTNATLAKKDVIDIWKIPPQTTLAHNDSVHSSVLMSTDSHAVKPITSVRQNASKLNGLHEPHQSHSDSHLSPPAIKSALDFKKRFPATEPLPLRSPETPVNALELGQSSIGAGNVSTLSLDFNVLQQLIEDRISRRFNQIQNMDVQEVQIGADIQNRDKIVLQRAGNSAQTANELGSVSFDSLGPSDLQSRTRVLTNTSEFRPTEHFNAISDQIAGPVSIPSRRIPEVSARPQRQMIQPAQNVIDLRTILENRETNTIHNSAPSIDPFLNSGLGRNSVLQNNALFSRGTIPQFQQQREQVNSHSLQHARPQRPRSSASLSSAFLNTPFNQASQVQIPLIRTFHPRTFLPQGQITPFVPFMQNRLMFL